MVFSPLQPRNVAGFRGTVRYASVNAHKNRVSGRAWPEGREGSEARAECAAEGEGGEGSLEVRRGWGRGWRLPFRTPIEGKVCL